MFDGDFSYSEKELWEIIRKALGRDMPFDIITTGRWEMAGRIATSYCQGRIFLAGDSAHQLPPTRGGFGANTGIDDTWNLAWKLQRVINGSSMPSLLDTYDTERRPIGWLRHQQTFSRPDYAQWVGTDFMPEPLLDDDAMEFGQLVRSAAIIGPARNYRWLHHLKTGLASQGLVRRMSGWSREVKQFLHWICLETTSY